MVRVLYYKGFLYCTPGKPVCDDHLVSCESRGEENLFIRRLVFLLRQVQDRVYLE